MFHTSNAAEFILAANVPCECGGGLVCRMAVCMTLLSGASWGRETSRKEYLYSLIIQLLLGAALLLLISTRYVYILVIGSTDRSIPICFCQASYLQTILYWMEQGCLDTILFTSHWCVVNGALGAGVLLAIRINTIRSDVILNHDSGSNTDPYCGFLRWTSVS